MAKILDVTDKLTPINEEKCRLREQLIFIRKMARAKSEALEKQLMLALRNKEEMGALEIVGDKAFEYHNDQYINISNNCDEAIQNAVDEGFEGGKGLKKIFCTLVKRGLSGFIANTAIGETEERIVFVFPENYSIVRVDVMAYKYTFSSNDILAKDVENVFVYTMAKSKVDYRKVDVDFLMHMVVDMMRTYSGEEPDLDAVMPFIRRLQACWMLLYESDRLLTCHNVSRGSRSELESDIRDKIRDMVSSLTPADILKAAKRFEDH